jgi:hypothetical protein
MFNFKNQSILFLFFFMIQSSLYAQEDSNAAQKQKTEEKKHSVNASVLGFLTSDYALNYVNMFSGSHAVMVEGEFSLKTDKNTSTYAYGGGIGYRLYMNPKQDSGFFGINARYRVGTWDTTVNSDPFSGVSTHYGVVVNVGRRWMFDTGFNLTIRIGTGYGKTTFDADQDNAAQAEKLMNGFVNLLPITFDGELSLGYCF